MRDFGRSSILGFGEPILRISTPSTRKFKKTLEPFTPMVAEAFSIHRGTALRHIETFEKHLFRTQGRRLARSGRNRRYMVDADLWAMFEQSYSAFTTEKFPSFEAALATLFTGEHPRARTLDDVHDLLSNQRESTAAIREMVDQLPEAVQQLRETMQRFQEDSAARFADLEARMQEQGKAAERMAGELREQATQLRQENSEHRASLQELIGMVENQTEGLRLVAAMVSDIHLHIPSDDA